MADCILAETSANNFTLSQTLILEKRWSCVYSRDHTQLFRDCLGGQQNRDTSQPFTFVKLKPAMAAADRRKMSIKKRKQKLAGHTQLAGEVPLKALWSVASLGKY